MLNILMSGAPGSGKGTQSQLVVEKYGLEHISTGDLLRKEVADKTTLGEEINSYISKGHLVPDELIINLLSQKLDSFSVEIKGIILDGFPRTLPQAEALEELLNERGTPTDVLIDVDVEEQELINRLLKRGEISGRTDDNLETIQQRLDVYHSQTKPINRYYQQKEKYVEVVGAGSIEEIFGRIETEIERILKKQ